VDGEHGVGDVRPFVIAGHHEHRHTGVGNALERTERGVHQTRGDARAEQHVATVDDRVDLATRGGLEGALVVCEEVRSAA